MKVTTSKLKDFLGDPGKYGSVLLYGNDYSKVDLYAQRITQIVTGGKEEFSVLRIDFSEAIKDPNLLFVSLTTVPMFHKKTFVVLTDAKDTLPCDLKHAIDRIDPQHSYLITQAKELAASSTLRSYYNNHPKYAAIACYKQDNVSGLVADFLSDNEISCSRETFRILCDLLQNSTACIKSDLEKLLLYLGESRVLSSDDIHKSFAADLDPALDDVCVAIVEGSLENFIKFTDALFQNKVPAVLVIRSSIKYFMTLEYLSRKVKDGCDIDATIKSFNPPIFFRLVPQLKRHAVNVPYKVIQLILRMLHETEIQCKTAETSQETVFKYFMYSLISNVQRVCSGNIASNAYFSASQPRGNTP